MKIIIITIKPEKLQKSTCKTDDLFHCFQKNILINIHNIKQVNEIHYTIFNKI